MTIQLRGNPVSEHTQDNNLEPMYHKSRQFLTIALGIIGTLNMRVVGRGSKTSISKFG